MKVTTKLLNKLTKIIIVTAFIGLLFSNMTPWMMADNDYEGKDFYCQYDIWAQGNESFAPVVDNIVYSEISFGILLFSSVIFLGYILTKNMKKNKIQDYLLSSIVFMDAFSISGVIFNTLLIIEIYDLQGGYFFSNNYIPLVLSIIALITTSTLSILVLPREIKRIKRNRREKSSFDGVDDNDHEKLQESDKSTRIKKNLIKRGEQEKSEEYSGISEKSDRIENVGIKCPHCGTDLIGKELLCPDCKNNLSTRCSNCESLIPSHKGRCPECGVKFDEEKDENKI